MREERAALQRFVALLLDLAERAQGHSRPVRRFVIWVLRQAETLARAFVIGLAEPRPSSMSIEPLGDADAIRLADDFRDLARELDLQARLAFTGPDRIHDDAGQGGLAGFGAFRTFDVDVVANISRWLTVGKIVRRAAWATGPPNTS